MKIHHLSLVAALALASSHTAGLAQSGAPAAVPGASAPVAAKPGPTIPTPAQMRDSAFPPDELQPQGPVIPQLSFPLGKKASGQAQPMVLPSRPAAAASAGGIDDAVARCEAQVSEQARASCRARLAREAPSR